MSSVTHHRYSASLLLAGPAGGEVRKVLGIRVAFDPPVLERERVKVDRAPVNNVHNGELGLSAKRAATVALQLLFREINLNEPVQRLWIDIEPPSLQVTGRSAELLFGLATYLHLGAASLPDGTPNSDFMATGLLDADGNVGSVEAIAVKIRAALATDPKDGTRLFYPRFDEGQISDELRTECRSKGLILCPVDRIDEALDALGVPILGSWPSGISPFRALEAFDSSFSRVFFGRQREVEALTSLLQTRAAAGRPGALVIGASGVGKSSFCLAGMLPALIKQKPGLEYAVWRPRDAVSGLGDEPASEQRLSQSILSQWQVRDDKQLGMALAQLPQSAPRLEDLPECLAATTGQCSIFVIDQFEELFTLNFTPQARIGFARLIQSLQARCIWVIGTLRSEFYASYLDLCDEDGQVVLTPLFDGDGQYNLPRMSRDAFSQVITRPTELAGLQFEQHANGVSLAQTLLADAMATDDALPLLGFALQKLYDEMERPEAADQPDAAFPRTLGFAAYERLGGLAGAIGTVAAEAYAALDAKAQAELPGLLNALAVPSADGSRETARPAPIDEWPLGTPGRRLINALTSIRVLVSEQGLTLDAPAVVRVAHEALFSHWELAVKLLLETRKDRITFAMYANRANHWAIAGKEDSLLIKTYNDLKYLKGTMDRLSKSTNDFAQVQEYYEISNAMQLADRVKRNRKVRYYGSIAAAIFFFLVFTFHRFQNEQYLTSAATLAASEGRSNEARLLALSSVFFSLGGTLSDKKAKEVGLTLPIILEMGQTNAESTILNEDGSIVVSGINTNDMPAAGDSQVYALPTQTWDGRTGAPLSSFNFNSSSISLSGNGHRMVMVDGSVDPSSGAIVVDPRNGRLIFKSSQQIISAQMSKDGQRSILNVLNVIGTNSRLANLLIDSQNGRLISQLAYDPDGDYYSYISEDGSIVVTGDGVVWDFETGKRLYSIQNPQGATIGSYDNDTKLFFIGQDGSPYLFDLQLRRVLRKFDLEDSRGRLANNGRYAFVISAGIAYIIDTSTQSMKKLSLDGSAQFGVFSRQGDRLLIWSDNGLGSIVDPNTQNVLHVLEGVEYGYAGGGSILIRKSDGSAYLYDTAREEAAKLIAGPGMAAEVSISNDGRALFTRSRVGFGTLQDATRIPKPGSGLSISEVCTMSGDGIGSFTDPAAHPEFGSVLKGRPWHPCDWRGLNEQEGWRQLGRMLLIRLGFSRDYQCGEVDARFTVSRDRSRRCNPPALA